MNILTYNDLSNEEKNCLFVNEIKKQLALAGYMKIEGFNEIFGLLDYPREAIPYILYETNTEFRQKINDMAKETVENGKYLPLPANENIMIIYK